MRINHNLMAMNTHRMLGINQNGTSKSIEKLSSGFRINRAGDDAAGLAISEKMRAQVRGLNQASRNAQDGISLIQTAEGALNETHDILQRMRELGVQAANGTNTDDDRAEIQKEVSELTSEINRIGNSTEFNTAKLLDGGADASGVSLSSTEAEGVAAKGAEIQGLNGVSFTAMSTISSAEEVLSISVYDVSGGGLDEFKIAGDDFKTLWDASDGAKIGATNETKKESLVNILNNNMSTSAWTTGYTAATSVKLGEVANINISDDGIFNIESKLAGNTNAASAELKMSFQTNNTTTSGATISNDFSTMLGQGAVSHTSTAGSTVMSSSFSASGVNQTEAKLFGSLEVENGDKFTAADFAGTSYTVNFNGVEANVTLAATLTAADTSGDIVSSALVTAFNVALDSVFGSGAIVMSITDDPNVEGTDTFFEFTTVTTTQATVNGEGMVTNSTQPFVSIAGDNLDKLLGDFVPSSDATGGTFSVDFQIGANTGQNISVGIGDMRSLALDISSASSAAEHDTTDAKFATMKTVASGDSGASVEYALDVSTTENAANAIDAIDEAISKVSSQRANLGAYQNRLEHTIKNLDTSSENMQAAESRIRDVDMAAEMMEFTKNNILQQAAQSMLAQANQQPQGVLQLLR